MYAIINARMQARRAGVLACAEKNKEISTITEELPVGTRKAWSDIWWKKLICGNGFLPMERRLYNLCYRS